MAFLESGSCYRSLRMGFRDTAARFIHDLATAGVPMALESVKAAADAVGRPCKVGHRADAALDHTPKGLPLVVTPSTLVGLS